MPSIPSIRVYILTHIFPGSDGARVSVALSIGPAYVIAPRDRYQLVALRISDNLLPLVLSRFKERLSQIFFFFSCVCLDWLLEAFNSRSGRVRGIVSLCNSRGYALSAGDCFLLFANGETGEREG